MNGLNMDRCIDRWMNGMKSLVEGGGGEEEGGNG